MSNEGFIQAYDQYADAIFRHCYFRVYDRELARDLMQETFKKTWIYITNGNKIENIKAFLYRIATNLVIDHKRKNGTISLDQLKEKGFEPEGDDKHDYIYTKLETERILSVVRQLDERSRQVILLRYVDGLTPKEISKATGRSQNVVSVSLNRAVKKVRELVNITKN